MKCDETLVQCWPQFILHPQTAPLKKFSHRFDIQLHIPLTSRKAHQTVMTMKGVRYRMTNDLHTNFSRLYNFSFQFHRRAAEPGCAAAHTPTLWITDLKKREIIWLFAPKRSASAEKVNVLLHLFFLLQINSAWAVCERLLSIVTPRCSNEDTSDEDTSVSFQDSELSLEATDSPKIESEHFLSHNSISQSTLYTGHHFNDAAG